MASRTRRNLLIGLAFLTPNILGFIGFTLLPLGLSLVLAFSNWDLRLHNIFRPDDWIKFVGVENFTRLFRNDDFVRFLGNTLFFMMGIPFSIAGSLLLATLLSKDLSGGKAKVRVSLLAGAVMFVACALLLVVGAGATATMVLMACLAGGLLVVGIAGGSTIYRTLFYLPSFTSGVAVFILWKKLYNPSTGPINASLAPIVHSLSNSVRATPGAFQAGMWALLAIAALAAVWTLAKLGRMWREGDLGSGAAVAPAALTVLPAALACGLGWLDPSWAGWLLAAVAAAALLWQLASCLGRREVACKPSEGFGTAAMFSLALMVLQFVLIGLTIWLGALPSLAAAEEGLSLPKWLGHSDWSKPAIMLMGFWAAIGSNNMLLYLAGLSNVPVELYEAAEMDGASRFQKFWHISWPQLAPTTFFIVVMSVIGGLQGGFETARTMTQGGPAGSTTTLSYFIYTEGFETGRLGYSSSVAWTLFVLVFTVTMFNWKFGNKYVND